MTLSLLPLAIGAVLITTAIPIELGSTAGLRPRLGIVDFIDNLILYAPLGIALSRFRGGIVLLAAGLISAVIEITQIWSIGRYPSWYDILANGLGALAAAMLWRTWFSADRARPVVVPVGVGMLAVVGIVAAAVVTVWTIPPRSTSLSEWTPDFALLLGDERSHDRPWLGTISELAVVPQALPRDLVRGLGRDGRPVIESLQGAGAVSLVADPLVMDGHGPVPVPVSVASRFGREAVAANAFSVAIRFTPLLAHQEGPARIVSYSAGILRRNFDVGQEGTRVTFRVATQVSGVNGEEHRVETPPALKEGAEALVVATYDGRVARLYRDGTLVGRSNLAAAGCVVAVVCGSGLGPAWAGLGGAAALVVFAAFGSIGAGLASLVAAIASAGTLLGVAWMTGSRYGPAGESWAWALALLGAALVGFARIRTGPDDSTSAPTS